MFLRSEHFDAKKAAQKIIKYFQFKLEMFGIANLTKSITVSDLNDGDMEYLQTGTLTKLPNRDRRGRICYTVCQKFQQYRSWQNLFRANCFFLEALVEDEATQKMGAVLIIYNVGFDVLKDSMLDRQVMSITNKMVESTPIRNSAVHYCYNDTKMLPALAVAQLALGRNNRLRFRTHYGSHTECQYSLMTFGIDPHGIPVDADGNRDLSVWQSWIQERHKLETEREAKYKKQANPKVIDYPSPTDVLLGRGRPSQEWPGNKRLSEIIDQFYPMFTDADRSTKTAISKGIVQSIHSSGGRFLKKDKTLNGWVLVSDYDGREKVSHAFRNLKQRNADRKMN